MSPSILNAYWHADQAMVRAYDSYWFHWLWWSYCVYPNG